MTPGISFHRGHKVLKLDKTVIDDAVEFPEDFEFRKNSDERKFFKNFIDDVTRFDEKVAHHTKQIYDAATEEIATWILEEARGNLKTVSVFSPNESIRNLRTALVQCNFTDVSRLIHDFRDKMLEISEEKRPISEMIVTENDAIHEVIDKISETSSHSLCVVMIRQFESLRPRFLDNLVSLLYSNSKCRTMIRNIRLLVCVSTSPALFTQNCELETMNMMEVKQFKFTKLDDIFSKVISTGIHKFFQPPLPQPKTIEEDDAKRLTTFDCAPAVFSGSFLSYLQTRFFSCDYSITAMTRAVQFAFLQKYLEDPLWREDSHDLELKKYDVVLKLFLKGFGEQTEHEFLKMHIQVQSNPNFWSEVREQTVFRENKQILFDGKSKTAILEFSDRLLKRMAKYDNKFCDKLENLRERLEEAEDSTENVEQTEKTPSKMSLSEFQKQRKQAMNAKQNNPISAAKSAIFSHIMSLFETVLQPYPATWRNVIGASSWSDDVVKTALDSSDEYDIENCLLNKNVDMPVSVAWRSLLCHRNFKMVSINDWAEIFLENVGFLI
uniref:ORC_WH_C domain-containing protein n=1 Tax=Caenorhabditis tropicalis TaxID=1561998 RepID=A0A1I7UK51_9PELO